MSNLVINNMRPRDMLKMLNMLKIVSWWGSKSAPLVGALWDRPIGRLDLHDDVFQNSVNLHRFVTNVATWG